MHRSMRRGTRWSSSTIASAKRTRCPARSGSLQAAGSSNIRQKAVCASRYSVSSLDSRNRRYDRATVPAARVHCSGQAPRYRQRACRGPPRRPSFAPDRPSDERQRARRSPTPAGADRRRRDARHLAVLRFVGPGGGRRVTGDRCAAAPPLPSEPVSTPPQRERSTLQFDPLRSIASVGSGQSATGANHSKIAFAPKARATNSQ